MRSNAWLVVILCAACTQDGAPGDNGAPGVNRDISVDGCREVLMIVGRDPEQLRAYLPSGFRPRDAAALLEGPPQTEITGQGAAYINAYTCDKHALGNPGLTGGGVAILVEPPLLDPDPGLEPSLFDFYSAEYHAAPGSPFADTLNATGFSVRPALADVAPSASGATGIVTDASGELFRFEMETPGTAGMDGIIRIWRRTPDGLAALELPFVDEPTDRDPIRSCALRPGSVAAQVLGVESCVPGTAIGVLFADQHHMGRYRTFPGVTVVE